MVVLGSGLGLGQTSKDKRYSAQNLVEENKSHSDGLTSEAFNESVPFK